MNLDLLLILTAVIMLIVGFAVGAILQKKATNVKLMVQIRLLRE